MRERWTETEDVTIRAHAATYGGGQAQWDVLALHLPGRSTDSIRNRWHRLGLHKLQDTDLDFDGLVGTTPVPPGSAKPSTRQYWTNEEDNFIVSAVERLGMSWRKIAKALPPQADGKLRSDSSVRNRWKRLCEASSGPPALTACPEGDDDEGLLGLPPLVTEPIVRERTASLSAPAAPEPAVRERAVSMPPALPSTAAVKPAGSGSGMRRMPHCDFPRPGPLFLRRDSSFKLDLCEASERSVERGARPSRWGASSSDDEDESASENLEDVGRLNAVLLALEDTGVTNDISTWGAGAPEPEQAAGAVEAEAVEAAEGEETFRSLSHLSQLLSDTTSGLKISAADIETVTSFVSLSARSSEL